MVKPKVFLSAGHGGYDPGAQAFGLVEKNINLNTMLTCREELVRHGVDVVCSRLRDENDPVQEEVVEANKSGCIIAMSFHANAGRGDGFEAFYWPGKEAARRLAQLCEKHVLAIGQNSRGIKTNNLMFTRETTMPAVLVESFFLDNDVDNNIGDTVAEQRAFGVAYAKAILEYLGIPYKAVNTTVNTSLEKYSGYVRVLYDGQEGLAIHSEPSWDDSTICGVVRKNEVFTIIGRIKVGGVYMYKIKSGAYITSAQVYVEYLASLPKAATPVKKTMSIGSKVKINKGAVNGGLNNRTRGIPIASESCGPIYTVRDIEVHNGVKEALIKEINSWVAVNSLTLL